MTGAGQSSPPPGWYPDPDGSPGLVRWWSGEAWSDVATPSGPGVAVQTSPLLAPSRPPAPAPMEVLASEPRSGRSSWVVWAAVLAILAVGAAALFFGRADEPAPVAKVPEGTSQPEPPAGPSFPPGTVRIIDEASGISYPFLGEGWSEWALWEQAETTETAGQYFTTQEVTPDGTTFISQCTSGPLIDSFGYSGPASLAVTTGQVADSVHFNYYPRPNERKVLRDEERTVDGHPAHLVELQLSWDIAGYEATGERAAVLLIDVGRPAPALLYVSIPNTHAELYGTIDRVLDAVEVL